MLPTEMSQRCCQWPAVMTSQAGVTVSSLTPRRSAMARATSMSKPSSWPFLTKEKGGLAASTAITMAPCALMRSSVALPANAVAGSMRAATAIARRRHSVIDPNLRVD